MSRRRQCCANEQLRVIEQSGAEDPPQIAFRYGQPLIIRDLDGTEIGAHAQPAVLAFGRQDAVLCRSAFLECTRTEGAPYGPPDAP